MATHGQRLIASAGITVEIEDHDFPDPGPNQMLVRVTRSQISAGSEMNGIRAIQNQPDVRRPIGYTTVGYVEKLGPGVADYREGDRVLCFGNHASHCLVSLTTTGGGDWQSQPDHVPDGITDEQAAFGVLGDVALHGVRRGTLQLDESVAVFGAGAVGQLTIQCDKPASVEPCHSTRVTYDSRHFLVNPMNSRRATILCQTFSQGAPHVSTVWPAGR